MKTVDLIGKSLEDGWKDFTIVVKSKLLWSIFIISKILTLVLKIEGKNYVSEYNLSFALIIPLMSILIMVYCYILENRIIFNLTHGTDENYFIESLKKNIKVFIYLVIIVGIVISGNFGFSFLDENGYLDWISPIEAILISFVIVFSMLYFFVRLFFLGIVFSIEDEKYSIMRSLKLSKGNFWKICILLIIFFSIVSMIISIMITILGMIFSNCEINEYFALLFIPVIALTEMYIMTIMLNFYKKIKDEKNMILKDDSYGREEDNTL